MAENPANRCHPRVVALSTPADRDQSAIYTYTAQQWGVAQAEDYVDFLHSLLQELADQPGIAPAVPNRDNIRVYTARWKHARQGHRIFFRETEDGIYVLRILHMAMNWPEHVEVD